MPYPLFCDRVFENSVFLLEPHASVWYLLSFRVLRGHMLSGVYSVRMNPTRCSSVKFPFNLDADYDSEYQKCSTCCDFVNVWGHDFSVPWYRGVWDHELALTESCHIMVIFLSRISQISPSKPRGIEKQL